MWVLVGYLGLIIFMLVFPATFDGLSELGTFSKYIAGIAFYGILLGTFLGYSFSSRQLKVSQNLLEQYRHRSIVSETIENIVAAVIKTKNGEEDSTSITQDELKELVRVAALAMFENRPIGHLSAKENTNPLMEIVNNK